MSKQTNQTFNSPTYGKLTFDQVRRYIIAFMEGDAQAKYRLVIGTDSQASNQLVDFVTAIVVHRLGGGGIYFWKRTVESKRMVMKQRVWNEASLSLSTASEFLGSFKYNGIASYEVEIHVDIGTVGETKEMIAEVVGMIRGSGFAVKTKPEAYGASKVADRHT